MTPAYAGWLIGSLAVFFFMAATNTLAGWLYVISGVSFALLAVAAVSPARSLRGIEITRKPISPVSVGDCLLIELAIANQTPQPKTLLQIQDLISPGLGQLVGGVLEKVPAHQVCAWTYSLVVERRGVFRWQTVQLRTAAPLGLFWCRRSRDVAAIAIVYPTVLSLTHCPLIDEIGGKHSQVQSASQRSQLANAGLTRTLRPYRWGDPTRLVHWRSSARYGELRVRELEVLTEGQEILICLDSATTWQSDHFEQAVIAAASLYFYARRYNPNAQLWTAGTGLVQGHQTVLEALAGVCPSETRRLGTQPKQPLIWLSQNPTSFSLLPSGSRWLLWPNTQTQASVPGGVLRAGQLARSSDLVNGRDLGIVIRPDQPLQLQLQSSLS